MEHSPWLNLSQGLKDLLLRLEKVVKVPSLFPSSSAFPFLHLRKLVSSPPFPGVGISPFFSSKVGALNRGWA